MRFDIPLRFVGPAGSGGAAPPPIHQNAPPTAGPSQAAGGVPQLVAVGQAHADGTSVFGLSRYRLDGSRDVNFADNGQARTALNGWFGPATAVAVDGGRRITAAGAVQLLAGLPQEISVVRAVVYSQDGHLERTFADIPVPDGSLPATCMTTTRSGREVFVDGSLLLRPQQLSVMKFGDHTADFGARVTGLPATALGGFQSGGPIIALRIDGRGRLLAVWEHGREMGIMRFDRQGRPDQTFGNLGQVQVPFDVGEARPVAVLVDSQERILIAGTAAREFAVARLRDGGQLDGLFGQGGKVFATNTSSEDFSVRWIGMNRDGRITVVAEGFFPV